MFLDGSPVIIYEAKSEKIVIKSTKGLINLSTKSTAPTSLMKLISHCLVEYQQHLPAVLVGLGSSTLTKYRKSLILVFTTSLLAQLFGLAIPLLIQQIIDKVLHREYE